MQHRKHSGERFLPEPVHRKPKSGDDFGTIHPPFVINQPVTSLPKAVKLDLSPVGIDQLVLLDPTGLVLVELLASVALARLRGSDLHHQVRWAIEIRLLEVPEVFFSHK